MCNQICYTYNMQLHKESTSFTKAYNYTLYVHKVNCANMRISQTVIGNSFNTAKLYLYIYIEQENLLGLQSHIDFCISISAENI